MTDDEKMSLLTTLLTENGQAPDSGLLLALLGVAESRIMERAYPFVSDKSTVDFPSRYDMLQVRIVQDMYNRRGAEGETAHNENGVSRTYEDSDKLLAQVVPFGKVSS